MGMDRDFVREAVLASINAERKIQAADLGDVDVVKDDSNAASPSRPKKRKSLRKVGENWKKLQKTLSIKKRPSRVKHETKHAKAKQLGGAVDNLDDMRFSAFMKREVRETDSLTKVVAMDCEMVGVGKEGKENALARVSVVNYAGDILYDSFVKVHDTVTDYRTQWSGVRPEDVSPRSVSAVEPFDAQCAVGEILKGRIVVGHAIKNDLRVLRISHPWRDIRDTSDFYKKLWNKHGRRGGRGPALRAIVAQVLGVDSFQKKEHDSCEDARAALALYKRNAKEWENSLKRKSNSVRKTRPKT